MQPVRAGTSLFWFFRRNHEAILKNIWTFIKNLFHEKVEFFNCLYVRIIIFPSWPAVLTKFAILQIKKIMRGFGPEIWALSVLKITDRFEELSVNWACFDENWFTIMAVGFRHIVILATVSYMFYHVLSGIERVRRQEVGWVFLNFF